MLSHCWSRSRCESSKTLCSELDSIRRVGNAALSLSLDRCRAIRFAVRVGSPTGGWED